MKNLFKFSPFVTSNIHLFMVEVSLHWVYMAPNDCEFLLFPDFLFAMFLCIMWEFIQFPHPIMLNYICSHDQWIPFFLLYQLPRKEMKTLGIQLKKERQFSTNILWCPFHASACLLTHHPFSTPPVLAHPFSTPFWDACS